MPQLRIKYKTGKSRPQHEVKMQQKVKAQHACARVPAPAHHHGHAHTFEILPVEIRQFIAGYLDEDKDLASYRLICSSTNYAIDEDEGSFWRMQFLNSYDFPLKSKLPSANRGTVNEWFKEEYQRRKRIERQPMVFLTGNTPNEVECLALVKDMLTETFNVGSCKTKKQLAYSPNVDRLEAITKSKGLLECVLRRPNTRGNDSPTNPVLLAVQLALTHLSLTASPTSKTAKVWGFPDSQTMVYMPSSSRPIFIGPNRQEIDLEWTLHVASFFRNYLLSQQELTHIQYGELESTERPQSWNKALSTSPLELGKHWKGTYAYVDHEEIADIRSGQHEKYLVQDHMCGEGSGEAFQDLRLDFPKGELQVWPPIFEEVLKSRTKSQYRTATTRAQSRTTGPYALPEAKPVSFCFKGDGEDASEAFLASGFFNPLPSQHGIPDWHRMTMMKYWIDEDTGEPDFNSLWAYEGVVLPGGMIMLGRWWHPNFDGDDEYSGPFIFWNVDASMPATAEDPPAID